MSKSMNLHELLENDAIKQLGANEDTQQTAALARIMAMESATSAEESKAKKHQNNWVIYKYKLWTSKEDETEEPKTVMDFKWRTDSNDTAIAHKLQVSKTSWTKFTEQQAKIRPSLTPPPYHP